MKYIKRLRKGSVVIIGLLCFYISVVWLVLGPMVLAAHYDNLDFLILYIVNFLIGAYALGLGLDE